MTHKKSPSGVAKNYIFRSAMKDRIKREFINIADEEAVLGELARAFPDMERQFARFNHDSRTWLNYSRKILPRISPYSR